MVTNAASVTAAGSHHGVFHYDTVSSDSDSASPLTDEAGTVHDTSAGTNHHITAYCRVRRDPSGQVYFWLLACVR
jgi:hypothetical protein